jgi:probable HAF family extracellular repeat protein
MKPRVLTCITAMTLFAALAIAVRLRLAAQEQPAVQGADAQHTRYKLIDLGTFGGPASYFSNGFDGILNDQGTAVGWADTSTPDPYPAFCFNPDCFVSHAFQSRNGGLTDLGTLPGGASSLAFWISPNGLIAGNAQNGEIDPLIPGFPQNRAVLWKDGKIINLGTLEGGYESLVSAVNSRGQVVGVAFNTVPDPFNGLFVTQARAFLWQNGVMQDLGTLGGPDANAFFVNEAGQVTGISFTDATPNSTTGFPTQDPFLWEHGTMLDLGTLGGTVGFPLAFNNRGEVVGQSNLAGDLIFHPFLWTRSQGIQDLGTLGGDTGTTEWISEVGDILGKADLPGPAPQTHDAVLWKDGVITDLGTLPGDSCSLAYQINSRSQIVGTSEPLEFCPGPCQVNCSGVHAFLWEDGGPMVDLNSLVSPGSNLQLTYAVAINDRGEIAGFGVPPGCSPPDYGTCGHAYVLIPCSEGEGGCGDSAERPGTATQINPASTSQRPSTATPANPALSGRGIPDRLRGRRFPGPG